MSILKIISNIDKATHAVDKATQTVDKISNVFDPQKAPAAKILSIEEREKRVRARIKEKGLQSFFRDIFPDL
jgi:hypothetical protein